MRKKGEQSITSHSCRPCRCLRCLSFPPAGVPFLEEDAVPMPARKASSRQGSTMSMTAVETEKTEAEEEWETLSQLNTRLGEQKVELRKRQQEEDAAKLLLAKKKLAASQIQGGCSAQRRAL
ncbi:hypothetical protein AK812_SmicGene31611 [Symbiodinium microadriaticum]|uniref:Uncharacterized protein n=1 Tax=Symbiodinium microadriaticum TaxID=2951 RepID=A0A1Q9CWB9_SYMMI|nr:hypothetical protein AK812_SmicGene31611 [Symbiodinium microadriaticum]